MNRTLTATATFVALLSSFLLYSCSGSPSSKAGPPSPTPPSPSTSSVQPESPAAEIDPCSLFSAADAQAIIGVPMQRSPGHGAIVCMYEEASPKVPATSAKVSLMVNVRKSVEEADRTWNNTKVVRRLKPGEKNITQLSGIGDEAWFDGNVQKGKVAIGGVLARKGKNTFALESATLDYRASADEMKKIAKRIADDLH
ncbi:MAG TPA: hypothetical protein VIB39_02490 [Candidatus Angelobacter sp.]|jgi:hypothetical protein